MCVKTPPREISYSEIASLSDLDPLSLRLLFVFREGGGNGDYELPHQGLGASRTRLRERRGRALLQPPHPRREGATGFGKLAHGTIE